MSDLLRVLFVDDEPAVLEALRNLLRRERQRWAMSFASSGSEALELLAREGADVVVSDMRMPGMDGAELLQRVMREHPAAARIVLSGYSDRSAALRSAGVAQQFLSKPCPADLLRATIERTQRLHALLAEPELRRIAGSVACLPTPSATYLELTRAVDDPHASMAAIATIAERDSALSAKVLQLVNSAYFGFASGVTSIQHAVRLLGVEVIRGLALTTHVFWALEAQTGAAVIEEQQTHALEVALLARRLAGPGYLGDAAFTAGMLHDIGTLVLAATAPSETPIGTNHAHLGAYLLGLWGLPFSIVEAVAFHHEPEVIDAEAGDVLAVVFAADALTHETRGEPTGLEAVVAHRTALAGTVAAWRNSH